MATMPSRSVKVSDRPNICNLRGAYFQSSFLLFAACECNKVGSISNDCDLVSGQCKCLSNFGGERCERCKHGYFQYPECKCKLGYLQEVSS